jgi:hypothetical protein
VPENVGMDESMTVTWLWEQAGHVKLTDGKLFFPKVPNVAGIYRFVLNDAAGGVGRVYIGEADPLPRRLQHYRTPSPRQQTNLRLNGIMIEVLRSGGRITMEIATRAHAAAPASAAIAALDLRWKSARVLVERAAEVAARTAGATLLNL